MNDLTVYSSSTFYNICISEEFYNKYITAFKNKNINTVLSLLGKLSSFIKQNNTPVSFNTNIKIKKQKEDIKLEKIKVVSADNSLKKAME